jgi:hypothetical protein
MCRGRKEMRISLQLRSEKVVGGAAGERRE